MTDDLNRDRPTEPPDSNPSEVEGDVDSRPDPDRAGDETPDESNPWLKEGADSPDAADIERPDQQR